MISCEGKKAKMKLLSVLLVILIIEYVQASEVCRLRKSPGPCKERFRRWYYNRSKGKCLQFFYGGCGGNGNNFGTIDACHKKCISLCERPKFSGPCKGNFRRWYFNKSEGKCVRFFYGGCNSNGNNFKTIRACKKKCKPICKRPKFRGPCNGRIRRWYYNKSKGKCFRFIYGGCLSNGNNFKTKSKCQKKCKSLHWKSGCK